MNTPAPWHVTTGNATSGPVHVIANPGNLIATIQPCQLIQQDDGTWYNPQLSNALLMAKAPQLRDALEALTFPSVISASDLRVLITLAGGTKESIDKAMVLADRLEKAQEAACTLLAEIGK